jgi:hypothetical protein
LRYSNNSGRTRQIPGTRLGKPLPGRCLARQQRASVPTVQPSKKTVRAILMELMRLRAVLAMTSRYMRWMRKTFKSEEFPARYA